MKKPKTLFFAVIFGSAALVACGESLTAPTDVFPRFDGHTLGSGHYSATTGHTFGSGGVTSGGHGFGSGGITSTSDADSTTARGGHGFGSGG